MMQDYLFYYVWRKRLLSSKILSMISSVKNTWKWKWNCICTSLRLIPRGFQSTNSFMGIDFLACFWRVSSVLPFELHTCLALFHQYFSQLHDYYFVVVFIIKLFIFSYMIILVFIPDIFFLFLNHFIPTWNIIWVSNRVLFRKI